MLPFDSLIVFDSQEQKRFPSVSLSLCRWQLVGPLVAEFVAAIEFGRTIYAPVDY